MKLYKTILTLAAVVIFLSLPKQHFKILFLIRFGNIWKNNVNFTYFNNANYREQMNISYMCFSVSQCTHGENWHLGEICVFFMECDGGWYARGLGGTTILFFCEKKRRSPFPRVVEGFRFLNLVMILIRYLNTCKKRLGQNLMVCKKAPAIFSSRLQFAKTLFCMVGGWLVCFKAIAFFFAEHRSFVIFAHFYPVCSLQSSPSVPPPQIGHSTY